MERPLPPMKYPMLKLHHFMNNSVKGTMSEGSEEIVEPGGRLTNNITVDVVVDSKRSLSSTGNLQRLF